MPGRELDFFQNRDKIESIGQPVTPEEVDVYRQLCELEDRTYKLRTILQAWERQKSQERGLRKCYGLLLLFLLFLQVIVVNVAFFLLGAGRLVVASWVAETFIVSVFAEMVGMVLIVVKYLFPKEGSPVPDILNKL